ncbi:MAG: hypothetical protein HY321_22330 [Armatimonadetes bacterium]|nr:hypothetical protein [Armatimonadota bacterium]
MNRESLDAALIGHFPFTGDCEDHSGVGLAVRNHGVRLLSRAPEGRPGGAASFDGAGAHLEVAGHPALALGRGDFSIATWLYTDAVSADVVGDLVSRFDGAARRGFQLAIVTNGGMTSTAQSNYRNLHFGVDQGRLEGAWEDCGRPGRAASITALKVSGGHLYAGTLEIGADEAGRLWRYEGGAEWTDLGNPVGCNAVHSVAEFDGALYCGLARYNTHGSLLGEVLNRTPGGQVYRVEADGRWVFAGHPGSEDAVPEATPTSGYSTGKADDAMGLTLYHGALYAISDHRCGVFRYEGGTRWRHIGPE